MVGSITYMRVEGIYNAGGSEGGFESPGIIRLAK